MDRMSECIRRLMQQNIVVAVGCTEPVAVALCVAKAKEILGKEVEKVELFLSGNIVKNAMGVGIPGTGKIGLPIAVALGVVCGDSSKQLQVLCSAKEHVNQAQQWLEKHTIDIKTKDTKEKLYIECHCYALNESAVAVISGTHTNFVHTEKNGEVLFHQDCKQEQQGCSDDMTAQNLTALQVWEYATLTPLEELQWIDETVTLNDKCSQQSLDGEYGLRIGKKLYGCWDKSIRAEIIGRTCAASDARMDGITLPIYSNSGSGNQGITCTLPVYYYGIKKNADKESITRALTLSYLMSIYIKSKIGRLSALCGVVNASMGAASGIALLAGCSFKQMCFALNNMINTITGMVCDGAKPSCALKISAGLNSAFDSVLLALDDIVVDTTDGIADADIDKSIASIGKIGRYGMDETDKLILDIMTEKNCSR